METLLLISVQKLQKVKLIFTNGWAMIGLFFIHTQEIILLSVQQSWARTAQLKEEFAKRDTRILAISVDGIESHQGWIKDINKTQNTNIEFPIIADPDQKISKSYAMIHENASMAATVRSVYFIGPDKKIKATITYPASTGRNFAEILRVLDSLQLTSKYSVDTPVDWEVGQDVVVSTTIKDEDIAAKFPKGYQKINSYLRYTPQPDK